MGQSEQYYAELGGVATPYILTVQMMTSIVQGPVVAPQSRKSLHLQIWVDLCNTIIQKMEKRRRKINLTK